MTRIPRSVLLVLGCSLVLVACAPEGRIETGSDNVPGENVVGQQWEGVPIYPQAEALSERSETGQVVTQSFATDQVSTRGVMDWFERELARDGWEATTKVHTIGPDSYRGDWIKDRSELRVTSTTGPELEEARGVTRATQFSLTLERAS